MVGTDQGRDDLLREARVLLGLTPHPSLPLVREDFFEGDEYVVVMDWVDGTDLARLLRDKGTPGLPLSSVLAYLAEAAEALTFLHTHDPPIIHGDVKPANLILTRGGRVKLVDFGLVLDTRDGGPAEGHRRVPGSGAGRRRAAVPRERRVRARCDRLCPAHRRAADGSAPPTWEGLDADAGRTAGGGDQGRSRTDPARGPATPGELVERLRSGWASTLPTGVMTFCMSDIEGSTRLWESQPGTMAESLVRHDELIAGVVEAHGGRFVKSMGEGDSTTSVFESATQAVRAAIDADARSGRRDLARWRPDPGSLRSAHRRGPEAGWRLLRARP